MGEDYLQLKKTTEDKLLRAPHVMIFTDCDRSVTCNSMQLLYSSSFLQSFWSGHVCSLFFTPPPVGGRGIVFGRFLCFFLSNITRKRLDRFAWNFREGVEWPWNDLIQFWVSSGQKSICLLSPAIAQTTGVNESVSFARWQQGAGFVVPRTTACFDGVTEQWSGCCRSCCCVPCSRSTSDCWVHSHQTTSGY